MAADALAQTPVRRSSGGNGLAKEEGRKMKEEFKRETPTLC